MTLNEREQQIRSTLNALREGWPVLSALLNERIADATRNLIAENNEQTRGAIKALNALLDLPETLQHELEGITAELTDEDSAN